MLFLRWLGSVCQLPRLIFEMTAKTITQRTQERRKRLKEHGLARLDVVAHPEDHKAIKEMAKKLTNERLKALQKAQDSA